MKTKEKENSFQIIVPAYNEGLTLESILEHARNHGYLEYLVVVDDASTDSTPLILERWSRDFGLRAIQLQNNCKKEGAIKVVMEVLREAGELNPYTLLLDSDSIIIGDSSGASIPNQIENYINHMKQSNCKGLALRIDASLRDSPTFIERCAFADYTAMQVDQWFVGCQKQLWVINGPGGIFESNQLLNILQKMVPDFETGDLLITVKLMIDQQSVEFASGFCIETLVPNNISAYFKQRSRWERGTTKVLWNEMFFYFGLFSRYRLLALLTVIHLLLYLGLASMIGLVALGILNWADFPYVLLLSAAIWFFISAIKGIIIKVLRPRFFFWRYLVFALMNSVLWIFITTPARLTGFSEAVKQMLFGKSRPTINENELVNYSWFGPALKAVENDLSREIVE